MALTEDFVEDGCCGACDRDSMLDGTCVCTPETCDHVGLTLLSEAEQVDLMRRFLGRTQ